MLFNSFEFVFVFLPLVVVVFFASAKFLGNTFAKVFLILASIFFYAYWNVKFLPVISISLIVNYFVALKIHGSQQNKKAWLIFGIVFNFLLLGYFKYAKFFMSIFGVDIESVILPLGISFFTFSQVAFLVNNYKGSINNAPFVNYFEFVMFFPYVTSGPIADFRNMNPQFDNAEIFKPNYDNIAAALNLFIVGLFKKAVIADYLGESIEDIFANANNLTMLEAWGGAVGYSMQLYFDFSGYSEMAIALALFFNIKIPENFNSPYQSTSIIEFWRRWHITLGAWVREYIYIPLGGNRNGEINKMRNLFIAMLFTGLWHGAGWTFILWGGLHGLMLIINNLWRKLKITLPKFLSWLITFMSVVICWVIFRAENLSGALKIIRTMFDFSKFTLPWKYGIYFKFLGRLGFSFDNTLMRAKPFGFMCIYIFMSLVLTLAFNPPQKSLAKFKYDYKFMLVIFILAIWSFWGFSQISDFLYFKF